MNKKILVLGIGNAQLDLIKECKKLGIEVYSCARDNNGPGKDYADHFSLIDIKEVDKIEKLVKENNIDYVFTVGSEVGVYSSAVVSERLQLPHFTSPETAKILRKKNEWRKRLENNSSAHIEFKTIREKSDIKSWSIYPSIMKPVDSSGQRGVYLLQNEEMFYEFYDKSVAYSQSKEVIIEEYADGPEISVNVYMVDGEIVFAQTSDRISFDEYPGGIIKKHIIPSSIGNEQTNNDIINMIKEISVRFNIKNGPMYFQLKIVNNKPKLIEFTPRFDGCHMWRLIEQYTKINLLDIVLKHLTEGKVDLGVFSNLSTDERSYNLDFLTEKPHEKVIRSNYKVKENMIYREWYYEEGEEVRPVNGYMEKVGYEIIVE